jgi:hypothetical protein
VKKKSQCMLVAASVSLMLAPDGHSGVDVTTRGLKPPQAENLPEDRGQEEAGDGTEKPGNIAVEGYTSARYVYGEMEDMGRGEVAGYIYQPGRGRTYVYGEAAPTVGLIYAYDNEGKRYVLSMKKKAEEAREQRSGPDRHGH